MNTRKRYLALAATAIICTASLPLGAMRTIKKTARRKMEELYQHGNSTTKEFLQTINSLVTDPNNTNNTKKRIFIAANISKMDTETLVFANSELEVQAPALSNLIKKEIEKKKLFLETNKRKREDSPEIKEVKKKKTNNEQKTCCPICLKNILKGYNPVTLPCKHSIHANCFLDIFKKTLDKGDILYACPLCKKEYFLEDVLSLIDKKTFISHNKMIALNRTLP
jgi:primosomal protein N'